jgi:hypothetical protein
MKHNQLFVILVDRINKTVGKIRFVSKIKCYKASNQETVSERRKHNYTPKYKYSKYTLPYLTPASPH